MKKLILLFALLLTSCGHSQKQAKINGTYWKAKIQDIMYVTDKVPVEEKDKKERYRLAICDDKVYIDVPEEYSLSYINLKYTGNVITYYYKENGHLTKTSVTNKGWERYEQ